MCDKSINEESDNVFAVLTKIARQLKTNFVFLERASARLISHEVGRS